MSVELDSWLQEYLEMNDYNELDPLLSVKEAADVCGVAKSSMYEILRNNPDLSYRPKPQTYKVIRDRLLEFMNNGGVWRDDDSRAA